MAVLCLLVVSLFTGCITTAQEQSSIKLKEQPILPGPNISYEEKDPGILLFRKLAEDTNGNLVFSPLSISIAMMMAYEGAEGETKKEIQEVFNIENEEELREYYKSLMAVLNRENKTYESSIANSVWAEQSLNLVQEFKELIKEHYDGELNSVNFIELPEEARQEINAWIEEKTNGLIKEMLGQGTIRPDTALVIVNAIYFKGSWEKKFNKIDTIKREFTKETGERVIADMMHITDGFYYAETDDLQILEMYYEGREISMVILLPKDSNLERLEKGLTTEKLKDWRNALSYKEAEVFFPKFKFGIPVLELKGYLREMGIKAAFSDYARFSMVENEDKTEIPLKIDKVLHKALIEVNEEGTEAAAATVIQLEICESNLEPEPVIPVFNADHPFVFIIQEKNSGNILFMGKVVNPNE